MTPQERRGRNIVLVIAVGSLIPSILVVGFLFAAGRLAQSPGAVVGLLIGFAISWSLYRGYAWARRYVPIAAAGYAILLVIRVFLSENAVIAIVVLPYAAILGLVAGVLWLSSSVDAYFRHQAPARETILSLHGDDGV